MSWEALPPLSNQGLRPPLGRWSPSAEPARWQPRQPLGGWGAPTSTPLVMARPRTGLLISATDMPSPAALPDIVAPVRSPQSETSPPAAITAQISAPAQVLQRQPLGYRQPLGQLRPGLPRPTAAPAPATVTPDLPDFSRPNPRNSSSAIQSPITSDAPSPLPSLQRQGEADESGDNEMPLGDSGTDTRTESVADRVTNRRTSPSPQSPGVQAAPATPLIEAQSSPVPTVPTSGATPAARNLEGDAPALQTAPAAAAADLSESAAIREEISPGVAPSPSSVNRPHPSDQSPIDAPAEGLALQASPERPAPLSPQIPSATPLPLQATPAPADSTSAATSPDSAAPLAATPAPPITNADRVQADALAETVQPFPTPAATEPVPNLSAQTALSPQRPAVVDPAVDSLSLAPESPGSIRPVQRVESPSPKLSELPPEATPSPPASPLQQAPETAPSSTAPSDTPAASLPPPALPTPAESSANSTTVGDRPLQAIREPIPTRITRATDPASSPPPSEPLALDAIQANSTSPASDSAQTPQPSPPGLPTLASPKDKQSSPLDSNSAVDLPSTSDVGDADVAHTSSLNPPHLSPSNALPRGEVSLRSEPTSTANPAVGRTEPKGTGEQPQNLIQPLPEPGVEPPAQPPVVNRISGPATSDRRSTPPLQRRATSPSTAEPWQQQFALDAGTPAPASTPTPETFPAAATPPQREPEPTVYHLGAPAIPAEAAAPEASEVSAEQLEQLARVCYSLMRSRLDLTHEAHYGRFPPRPPWVDACYLPASTDPPAPGVQTSPSLDLDLEAVSLGLDEAIATLVEEVQSMVHQHGWDERERSQFQYIHCLRR